MLTLSRISGQVSAAPAFVTGMILMSWAFRTSFVDVDVKKELIFTFHFVVSHVKACKEPIDPAQTNVHSAPFMYWLYLSSER